MSNYSNHHNYQDEEIKKDFNSLVTMLGLSLVGALGYIAVQDFIKKYKNSGNLDDKIKEVKPSYHSSNTNNQTKSKAKVEPKRDFQSSVSDVCDKLQKDCAKLEKYHQLDDKAKSKTKDNPRSANYKNFYKNTNLKFIKVQQSSLLDVLDMWKHLDLTFGLKGSKLRYASSNLKLTIESIAFLTSPYFKLRFKHSFVNKVDKDMLTDIFKKIYKTVEQNSKD